MDVMRTIILGSTKEDRTKAMRAALKQNRAAMRAAEDALEEGIRTLEVAVRAAIDMPPEVVERAVAEHVVLKKMRNARAVLSWLLIAEDE